MVAVGAHPEHVPVERTVRRERERGHELDLVVGEAVEAAGDDELELRALVIADCTRQREQLLGRRAARRHRVPVAVVVCVRLRAREAEGTRVECVVEHGGHVLDLGFGRGPFGCALAHRDPAQRAVPGEEAGVHRHAARLDLGEVVAEAGPVPRDARLERRERDALDPGHEPGEVLGVLLARGRQRETAVPADDRGHSVEQRRARARIPEELRVVVRVEVHEPGREGQAVGLDGARRAIFDVTDRHDVTGANPDVGLTRGRAGAVDHGRAADEQIEPGPAHAPTAGVSAGTCRSVGTGWRNSFDAFSQVILRTSSLLNPASPARASS